MTFGPAIFDRDVQTFRETGFAQSLAECRHETRQGRGRCTVEIAYHRHRRLLRARNERPRYCAAEKRDEIAPFQSIELHPLPQPWTDKDSGLAGIKSGLGALRDFDATFDRFGSS